LFEEGGALSQNRGPPRLNHGIIRNVSQPPSDDIISISSDGSNDSSDSSIQVIHFKCFQVHDIEIFIRNFTILLLYNNLF